MHTHTHTHTRTTCIHAYARTHTYAHIYARTHIYVHARTHTHTLVAWINIYLCSHASLCVCVLYVAVLRYC